MIVKGKYNEAVVFVDKLDANAYDQIKNLVDQEFTKGLTIRIMPDVHVGAGSVIGTTMTISNKVVPNLVGVDIGCGLIVLKLKDKIIDFKKLDKIIKENNPSGFSIRARRHPYVKHINIDKLKCSEYVDLNRGYLSVGTLGGGNHFIEINEDEDFNKYLVIHSGSRNIGLSVAEYYQKLAIKYAKENNINIENALAYLDNELMDDYLYDMKIMQEYAYYNRKAMADIIVSEMNFEVVDSFQTIHNYIDLDLMILRKGAVSALKNEKFIIPLNMADGSLILEGLGNPEYNYSAPHGAGRVLSRSVARKKLDMSDFKESMDGIYSTSISYRTIDESPMAYKDPSDIINNISETAKIISRLKVLYNFKA